MLQAESQGKTPALACDRLDDARIPQITSSDSIGTPMQLIKRFGREDFERAVHELQSALDEGAA